MYDANRHQITDLTRIEVADGSSGGGFHILQPLGGDNSTLLRFFYRQDGSEAYLAVSVEISDAEAVIEDLEIAAASLREKLDELVEATNARSEGVANLTYEGRESLRTS
jgi:hypothetical protein